MIFEILLLLYFIGSLLGLWLLFKKVGNKQVGPFRLVCLCFFCIELSSFLVLLIVGFFCQTEYGLSVR